MKAGRNDPCPCGSGKKYKKCCIAKDGSAAPSSMIPIPVAPSSRVPDRDSRQSPSSGQPTQSRSPAQTPVPSLPLDPMDAKRESYWEAFKSRNGEDQVAVFLEALEEDEVMTDDLAFEMCNALHEDAVKSGNRERYAECVAAFRNRRPEVFQQGSHFYLANCLDDALAEGWHQLVPSLARELAGTAGRDIDIFNHTVEKLAYHGQLPVLVEALRLAWPLVKSSKDVIPWGVSEFAENGVTYEIFNYLEHTPTPDLADPVLLDHIHFFIDDPREADLAELITDLAGKSDREWRMIDFDLSRPQKTTRDMWDDDDDDDDDEKEEQEPLDPGAANLYRLTTQFVAYLRREEAVPYPRGELVRHDLGRYFLLRRDGDLDPRPSMLEQMQKPNRKPPKPPRPVHTLCPERMTLEIYLGRLMGMMSGRYHTAAALFLAFPAWLRFLESQRLIDATTREQVTKDLTPLHTTLMALWKQHDDPLLYRDGQSWLGSPAQGDDER
jgi:SEC-C motif